MDAAHLLADVLRREGLDPEVIESAPGRAGLVPVGLHAARVRRREQPAELPRVQLELQFNPLFKREGWKLEKFQILDLLRG